MKFLFAATLFAIVGVLPARADITPTQRTEIQAHLDKARELMAGVEPNTIDAQNECRQALEMAAKITDSGPNLKSLLADAYRYRGEAYSKENQWKVAVANFDAALKINPNDVESLIGRGEADSHINLGLFSQIKENPEVEPLDDFNAALKIDPKSARAYVARGNFFQIGFSSDDTSKKALAEYEKATQVDPTYAEGWFQHAKVLLLLDDSDRDAKAKSDFDRAIALSPKAEYFSARGTFMLRTPPRDYPAIIADFTSAITLDPSNPKRYIDRAGAQKFTPNSDKKQMMADYSKAIELLKKKRDDLESMAGFGIVDTKSLTQNTSDLSSALQLHGDLNLENHNGRAALGDYNAALKLVPTNDDALAGRVRLIASTGQLQIAIDEASARIAKVRKDHGESNARNLFAARANVFLSSKRYDEALLDFNQAIVSDSMPGFNRYSQHADWYYNRAFLWSQKRDDVHALADYNVATKLNPAFTEKLKGTRFEKVLSPRDPDATVLVENGDTALLHKLIGNEWISAGSLENAISEFGKAIALDPNYADAYNNRGLAQMNLKKLEAAESDMDKAISLKATDPRFFINRSTLRLYQQRAADAVADAKKATELDGKNADFWNALATAQELNGEFAAAETTLNTELELITSREAGLRVRGKIALAHAFQNLPPGDKRDELLGAMSGDQRKSLLDATEAAIELHPEIAALGEMRAAIVAVDDRVKKQPMFIP